jgi:mRNA-degrading endonuclease RelE of RelBE toxin-antitoxin system
MFGYVFHPSAEKELARLPLRDQRHVLDDLNTLRTLPPHPLRSRYVIKLAGYREPTYRLRVGEWRVIFLIRERMLYIISVRPRQRGYGLD